MVKIPRGVRNRGANVFWLQVWEVGEDLFRGRATSEHVENVFNTNAHSTNARAAAALIGINRDPFKAVHGSSVTSRGLVATVV
jgi:hypothetical protein